MDSSSTGLSRREFLATALGSSGLLLLASCRGVSLPTQAEVQPPPSQTSALAASAASSGVEISLLQWNNFIPPADPFFKQQAAEWGKQTGVSVTVETINAVD